MNSNNYDFEKQAENINKNMSSIKNKILVMSGKGGVGKTTVAVNLACAMAKKGFKTGLLDIDLHGPNVPKMLGIDSFKMTVDKNQQILPYKVNDNLLVCSLAMLGADNQTPIIWRGPLKAAAIRQMLGDVRWGELDYLFLDCPPGTGDEILSAFQAVQDWTGAVVVTTAQEVAIDDAKRSLAFANQVGLKVLGIVENMSGFICPHCGQESNIFKKGGGEDLAKVYGTEFLGRVPLELGIVTLADSGKAAALTAGQGTVSESFEEISNKIQKNSILETSKA